MPNNCSSMILKIYIVTSLFIVVSCSSIKTDSFSNTFSGKIFINKNNIEQNSFNIQLTINKYESIIQIQKPFLGNVLKIEASEGKNLVILPSEYSEPFKIPNSISRNFKYWLRQCIYGKNFETYDPENLFYYKCFKEKNKTNFFVGFEDIEINGYIKRK